MSPSPARSLVPPRPNLGPEPWPSKAPLSPLWLILGAASALLIVWVTWRRLRRKLARLGRDSARPDSPDATPRGRLVALSISAKNALAARFGTTWRAKTTEEIAIEPLLLEILGPESLGDLLAFLDRIDRLKFAPERTSRARQNLEQELADWQPRISAVLSRIESWRNGRPAKAPPRSRPAEVARR